MIHLRRILHLDLDAFFASVEQLDNKKLRGKPVIVGGKSDRGVVSTCSYEARKYGVHSAMPIFMAKKKCPHGIYLKVRHDRYKEVSKEVFKIYYEFTDLVEPLSIDEAYLDITELKEDSFIIAKKIKEKVYEQIGLTLSAGISYNKFLAKLASDWNKPDGIKVIKKSDVPEILKPLSVGQVYGIGKKSKKRLNNIGIYTIEDLFQVDKKYLDEFFGKSGAEIYNRIRGIDNREIKVHRERKSIGRETTLKQDTKDRKYLKTYLLRFSKEISKTLTNKGILARTITVKIKTIDFQIHTKSKSINMYIDLWKDIYDLAEDILKEIEIKKGIRLIGLTVSNFSKQRMKQLSFFDLNYMNWSD